jgi:hypothetical protein
MKFKSTLKDKLGDLRCREQIQRRRNICYLHMGDVDLSLLTYPPTPKASLTLTLLN